MEIDLAEGSQLVYVIPDIMLTVGDFFRNIQVSILTRGYEQWSHGEANLLITRGLVGRLSNTPNVGFAYEVQGVVDYLTSHDVQALPGRSRISLSFDNYTIATSTRAIQFNDKDEETQSDEESFHTLAVLIDNASGDQTSKNQHELSCDERPITTKDEHSFILVRKLSPFAVIPQRKTSGAAGTSIRKPYRDYKPIDLCPRFMDLSDDATDTEDDFLSHIQYLANLTTPIASPEPTDTIWDSYQDTSEDE
ncbi:hypothetical protein ZIOFF_061840 [Zingiber officinale]|uniref:Polyprotein n=1 Tax=Zingiber officinale TaxID=94328 RepID=A0A8J5EZY7_ZINOF|nr:hypothetical protein ZIOFF_061840 [Zingiber officinale]